MAVYSSWEDVRTGLDPGEVIHIGKQDLPHPRKEGFKVSYMSIRDWTGAARRVFHDTRQRNSLRIYDHEDYFRATVVDSNPDAGLEAAVEHALVDTPVETALALSVGYGVYQTLRSIGSSKGSSSES